jgi:hypothetical protein
MAGFVFKVLAFILPANYPIYSCCETNEWLKRICRSLNLAKVGGMVNRE